MAASGEIMRAVIIESIGRARVLKPARLPRPQPAAHEVLVKVHATSVNPVDLHLRRGRLLLHKPLPHILGADLAGEVAGIGADAAGWQLGERVYASFKRLGSAIDGGYAEYCAVPAAELSPLPDALSYQAAVAAGASFAQALYALTTPGKLKKADTLVVWGAADAVGSAAVPIAAARGAKVIAISEARFAADLRALGADVVLEDAGKDLVRQVKVATEDSGASLALHCRPKLDLTEALAMLAPGGRLVIAGALHKPALKLKARELYLRNLSLHGAVGWLKKKEREALLRDLARGKYSAPVAEVLPLSQARAAHQKQEREPGFGKIVLVPDAILKAAQKPDTWIPIE